MSRASGLTRTVSQRQLRVKVGPDDSASKDSGTLKRASSTSKKCPESSGGSGANAETLLKGTGTGERSSKILSQTQGLKAGHPRKDSLSFAEVMRPVYISAF